MSKTVYLPYTLQNWPYPRSIHPRFDQFKSESEAWINSFRSSFSPKLQNAFIKCDYSLLASMAWSDLSDEGVRISCDLMALFLVYDEWTDELEPIDAKILSDIVMDALRNPSKPRPDGEHVVGEITRQFWDKTVRIASPTSQIRFIKTFQEYVDAVVQESADRQENYVHTTQTYFQLRRDTSGAMSCLAFYEIDLTIPDYAMENDVVRRLITAAADMITMDNDLFSYNVEQARGDVSHNLVTVVMREFGFTVQEAFDWVGDKFKEISDGFLEDRHNLPYWGPEVDHPINRFINRLGIWVRGNNQWSYEGHRYFGSDGMRVLTERTIRLLPRSS